jgi:hypothetical protein
MKKRGVVEVQFNWIFILIAGGVILFFFVSLISKQQATSEFSSNVDVLQYIDKLISGTETETATTRNITINNLNLKVSDGSITLADKRIEGKSLKNKIVFAPDLIKGNKLITHSLSWSCPYKVTNFLYLTSNEIRYMIANNTADIDKREDPFLEQISSLMPAFTTIEMKEYISDDIDLEKYNNYEVRFIFFNKTVLPKITIPKDSKYTVSALNIEPLDFSETIDGYGKVYFYRWDEDRNMFLPSGTSYYLKKESLLGAIISDDVKLYDENMKKAMTKLNLITNLSYSKEIKLKDYCATNSGKCDSLCISSYETAEQELKNLLFLTNTPQIIVSGDIYANSLELDRENIVFQLHSCPALY